MENSYVTTLKLVIKFRGLQHRIHARVLRGLYPGAAEVERALALTDGVEKTVLDVGTGPGHW